MKTPNLKRVALSVALAAQLISADAFAGNKFKEVLLTSKSDSLMDPYFQVRSTKIIELTEVEAMEFINNSIPSIPPSPPEDLGDDEFGINKATGASFAAASGGAGQAPKPTGFFEGVIMIADKLIAIGQKIMPTIDKGRAVVTNNPMSAVSVLPRLDTKDPVVHEMGDWSLPQTKHYKITYANGLGLEVVSFVYSISFQHSGTYAGQGKYLTGIRASARNISISWGFDLDASSQLIQISNVGTTQDVVAGATIEISYTIKNFTRQITTNESFFVAGDGRLFKLDS